jgi:hypothetical protein
MLINTHWEIKGRFLFNLISNKESVHAREKVGTCYWFGSGKVRFMCGGVYEKHIQPLYGLAMPRLACLITFFIWPLISFNI